MNGFNENAFKSTLEIVVARVGHDNDPIGNKSGELIGEFFNAIYSKLKEISESDGE